ncbi:hypothetical protein CTEN210_04092 [Chaetoceros tenuissimus]|uniref:Plastid lipid-associated protein/fibrillin conserved domain-containing protein n=1 Tax=Chaetoceros tenuissimus TaxID=426638 RepID=A0AAD3CKA6_9STRA|nr:hypothetical protein CTEN210_04092 [Chaetoceros tenuissimus]
MKFNPAFVALAMLPSSQAFVSMTTCSNRCLVQGQQQSRFIPHTSLFAEEESTEPESIEAGDTILAEKEETVDEILSEENKDDTSEEPTETAEPSSTISKEKLLQKLLIIASSTDRGQFASSSQKESMSDLISQIESTNYIEGTKKPCNSDLIQGTWELLYSDTQLFRSSPFFMAGRAVCKTEEEAQRYDWFCDMHRAALAISEIGKVRQIISDSRLFSEFEVNVGSIPFLSDYTPFSYSGGLPFTINGAIVSSADITPTTEGNAWEIYMDTVEIKGSNIPLLRSILDNEQVALKSRDLASVLEDNLPDYSTPRPVFETTYLDDTIRISRDQDGKVFVYGKLDDIVEPTSYDSVDADLGILKLLEGLNDNFVKFSL